MKIKVNPILSKEVRVRMRSWKAPLLIAIYTGILAFVAVFILFNTVLDPYQHSFRSSEIIESYAVLSGIQFLLIAFIVPALTSSSISGERERQTLDLILCTKLPSQSIILGKLITSISQILLLIIAALPVFSVVLLFGGISFKEISQLFIYYIVLAITFGSIGIFFSTYIKKTTTATVLTYATILFLMLGTLVITVFYLEINNKYNPQPYKNSLPLMYFNPGAGYVSLIAEQFGKGNSLNIPGVIHNPGLKAIPFWIVNIIIDLIISVVLLVLSALKLNPMKKIKKLKK
ncbi:ABC transporter permease [Haloimpatiens sp. FM7330]|uniref:ABC transporter permease n=1 Tax=Haloimpatiens sp. FM7330 TaxID=3298610 RepID=UPI003638267E